MTLLVPAVLDALSTDADAIRRAIQTLSPGQVSAVLGTGDLKVTTSGGMVSVLAAGKGLALGTQNATTQGVIGLANDAAVSQTHAAADGTNPRNDLVGVKIEDAFYSGSTKQATPVIITGTPAASPVDPAVPANYLPCARVRVGAGASTLGTITDLRSFVFQTILPGGNGFKVRDSTNAFDNLALSDAGVLTIRSTIVSVTSNYRAYAYAGSSQSLAAGTPALINLNAEDYDPNSNFDTTTHLYTCPAAGTYLVCWALESDINTTLLASIRQAGSRSQTYFGCTTLNAAGNRPISAGATFIKAAAGDTFGLWEEVTTVTGNVGDVNTLGKNFMAVQWSSP